MIAPQGKSQGKKTKRLITIHSQKGGVGKTLIALHLARKFAQRGDGGLGLRTVLLDADLTGTSLAEAVPLRAPYPKKKSFYSLKRTRKRLRDISGQNNPRRGHPNAEANRVKFLNDILFCDPIHYHRFMEDSEKDQYPSFKKRHLLWRVDDPHECTHGHELDLLRVIPSSGLPRHVARCLPHIYKEVAIAFLQRRLMETTLSLWFETEKWDAYHPFDVVVIDTPPVLHGVSRAVLQLHSAIKDKRREQKALQSIDYDIKHIALFVSSADQQDSAALVRAMDELLSEQEKESKKDEKSSGTPSGNSQNMEVVLVLNRIPLIEVGFLDSAVALGESQTAVLKDRYVILQHFATSYEQFHQVQSKSMKRPATRLSDQGLPPLLGNPERTFPIHFHDDLAGVYVDKLHSEMYLYSPGIDQLNRLYEVIADV